MAAAKAAVYAHSGQWCINREITRFFSARGCKIICCFMQGVVEQMN